MKKCKKCGGTIHKVKCLLCELFATAKAPGGDQSKGWPRASLALSVPPDEVPKFMDDAKKMGVPTNFNADGFPVFENQSHQRKYEKVYGYVNKDSFY